jgi:hypothetical protein
LSLYCGRCVSNRDASVHAAEAIKGLAAAVATDIYDEEKDREREKQEVRFVRLEGLGLASGIGFWVCGLGI